MMVIVDASAAVKWFIQEEGSDKAETLFQTPNACVAPDILELELVNTFAKLVRMKIFQPDDAEKASHTWRHVLDSGKIRLEPFYPILSRAFSLALSSHHTVADCVYVEMARSHGYPLATFDVRQQDVARQAGVAVYNFN